MSQWSRVQTVFRSPRSAGFRSGAGPLEIRLPFTKGYDSVSCRFPSISDASLKGVKGRVLKRRRHTAESLFSCSLLSEHVPVYVSESWSMSVSWRKPVTSTPQQVTGHVGGVMNHWVRQESGEEVSLREMRCVRFCNHIALEQMQLSSVWCSAVKCSSAQIPCLLHSSSILEFPRSLGFEAGPQAW